MITGRDYISWFVQYRTPAKNEINKQRKYDHLLPIIDAKQLEQPQKWLEQPTIHWFTFNLKFMNLKSQLSLYTKNSLKERENQYR